jgi:anti-sigma factor RsiW
MICDDVDELLSDLIDDELAEGARASVLAHIATCERCDTSHRALKRTVRFVRANATTRLVPGTPGGDYQQFERALMDDSLGTTATEIAQRTLSEIAHENGGTS